MTKEKAKHLSDVLKAYSEGKTIQYKFYDNIGKLYVWKDLTESIIIDFRYGEYRIKPEPKYRPYANAEEFLEAQKEHGPMLRPHFDKMSFMPLQVSGESNYIVLNAKAYESLSFKKLIDDKWYWVWQDGTPCGVEEEQL